MAGTKKLSASASARVRNRQTAQTKKKASKESAPSQTVPAASKTRPKARAVSKPSSKKAPRNINTELSQDQDAAAAEILAGMASRKVTYTLPRNSSPIEEAEPEPEVVISDEEEEGDLERGDYDVADSQAEEEEEDALEEVDSERELTYFKDLMAQREKGVLAHSLCNKYLLTYYYGAS